MAFLRPYIAQQHDSLQYNTLVETGASITSQRSEISYLTVCILLYVVWITQAMAQSACSAAPAARVNAFAAIIDRWTFTCVVHNYCSCAQSTATFSQIVFQKHRLLEVHLHLEITCLWLHQCKRSFKRPCFENFLKVAGLFYISHWLFCKRLSDNTFDTPAYHFHMIVPQQALCVAGEALFTFPVFIFFSWTGTAF